MRESLTKRGELVHNLEILSEISPLSGTGSCPCWFEDGWGTLSYSYPKMVKSFTKNLTENQFQIIKVHLLSPPPQCKGELKLQELDKIG